MSKANAEYIQRDTWKSPEGCRMKPSSMNALRWSCPRCKNFLRRSDDSPEFCALCNKSIKAVGSR